MEAATAFLPCTMMSMATITIFSPLQASAFQDQDGGFRLAAHIWAMTKPSFSTPPYSTAMCVTNLESSNTFKFFNTHGVIKCDAKIDVN